MEKYTKSTRFCMVCNYVNNIIPALQSRCMRFRFTPLQQEQVTKKLAQIAELEGVNLAPKGLEAIYKISGGDMRKCIMILQSTHLSFGRVDEETVYSCTGHPNPADAWNFLNIMLNKSYQDAHNEVMKFKSDKGFALTDVLREMPAFIMRMKITDDVRIFLLDKLSDIEYNLAMGASEKLQTSAMIGAFQIAREVITSKNNLTIGIVVQPSLYPAV
jgi:replication factor C subunit 3/5